jgi:hypothetical protein
VQGMVHTRVAPEWPQMQNAEPAVRPTPRFSGSGGRILRPEGNALEAVLSTRIVRRAA